MLRLNHPPTISAVFFCLSVLLGIHPVFTVTPFGSWFVDESGLPAFNYTMNEYTDSRANYSTSEGTKNDHFHLLGNGSIQALAYNHGWVELFSNERGSLWLNKWKFWENRFAGGYGFLKANNSVYSLRYLDVPPEATYKRNFGVGYFSKTMKRGDITVTQKISAPNANISALVSEVMVENTGPFPIEVTWYEYWDINPDYIGDRIPTQSKSNAIQDFKLSTTQEENALVCRITADNPPVSRKERSVIDYYPPSLYLTYLDAGQEIESFETRRSTAFNSNGIFTGDLSNGLVTNVLVGEANACLILSKAMTVPANGASSISFILGYTREADIKGEIEKARKKAESAWKPSDLAGVKIGSSENEYKDEELEMMWHSYYLRAMSYYDEYFDARMLSQGGWYQFGVGSQMAARDPLQHILPMIYIDPALAKDVIRYTLQEMNLNLRGGYIKYGVHGVGALHDWDNPYVSDTMLYLFLAIVEYVNATRDYAFLSEVLPYYPKEKGLTGTVREHLEHAYNHQIQHVGIGDHGLIKLRDADWNDILHQLNCGENEQCGELSESVLNTSIAAYVFPRFAKMVRKSGKAQWADEIENMASGIDSLADGLKRALKEQFNGSYFNRAVFYQNGQYQTAGGKSGGINNFMFLAPQPWGVLSDVLTQSQEKALVELIHNKLNTNLGAKNQDDGTAEGGGVWFALNFPLIMAYARTNPGYAWEIWRNMTLANHARHYPNTWIGLWSGPDAYNVNSWDEDGETWSIPFNLQGYGYMMDFPVFIAHSHAVPWYGLIKLMGIEPTSDGYTIDATNMPEEEYSFDNSDLLSLEKTNQHISFSIAPKGTVSSQWKIITNKKPVTVFVNGNPADFKTRRDTTFFTTELIKGEKQESVECEAEPR